MRAFRTYFLNNFQRFHTAVLTIIIILYITSPVLTYLVTGSLCLLTMSLEFQFQPRHKEPPNPTPSPSPVGNLTHWAHTPPAVSEGWTSPIFLKVELQTRGLHAIEQESRDLYISHHRYRHSDRPTGKSHEPFCPQQTIIKPVSTEGE